MAEARFHGAAVRGSRSVPLSPLFEGRFGRMFRRLPSLLVPDGVDPDEYVRPLADLMAEPEAAGGWGGTPQDLDNPRIAAGWTYFGQFVDHDITFDPVSSLDQQNDPDALTDFRTPRYDLDSVYGSGPADEPFQYQLDDGDKFLIGGNSAAFDLPRNAQGLALIGDPRNRKVHPPTEHRTALGRDLVFARDDGRPIHPDYFSQTFERTVKKLGLPRIRLHDLRHTNATLGLAAGIPVKVMSERLGHATTSFTQDVYMHAIPALEEEAAVRLGNLLFDPLGERADDHVKRGDEPDA